MTNSNDVDVNALIKIYNQKISTLTNQNILLEAKLQTIVQDHLDAQKELFTLNLVSREAITNKTVRVGRKFPSSQNISDSVSDIIKDYLKGIIPLRNL